MNMEGYGPVATGMGGASMAYDNGTAAMMNNPATLALMDEGSRADLAFGFLGPDVNSSVAGASSRSTADAFSMPAFGWVRKRGKVAYGFGIYGQGGMGTEYDSNSIFSNPGNQTASPHLVNRSEVSVGRVILPLTYDVDPDLRIGGSLDYVWAGMDLQMALSGQEFLQLAGGTSRMGTATGTMIGSFVNNVMPGLDPGNPINLGYFDFSNRNDYTGQAVGTGYAGKIGLVYKVNPKLTVGAAYHSKTRLSDLEAAQATVLFNVNFNGGPADQAVPVEGKIAVRNFQWPDTYGLGIAYQANDRWLVTADYKRINWSHTMKDFTMTFSAQGNTGPAAAFNGTSMDVVFFQDWRDQHVLMIGAAYRTTEALTLRAGLNVANNPVPDEFVHYLFPATIKNHVTAGFGYAFSKASSIDFSLTYAPEVTVTSAVTGVTTSHGQNNWQFLYSYRY
jgi:long-chain fatty acid transport protein